jgi:hypothetical protein
VGAQEALLNRLFDQVALLETQLKDVVGRLLRVEFETREYRDAMYDVPQIVKKLNAEWRQDPIFAHYRDLVRVEFTALVIRPRQEAEQRFLAQRSAHQHNLRDQTERLEQDVKQARARRSKELNELQQLWEASLADLPRVVDTIAKSAAGLEKVIKAAARGEQITRHVTPLFENSRAQFEASSDRLLETLTRLGEFLEGLWTENGDIQKQLDQIRAGYRPGLFNEIPRSNRL